MPFGALPQGLRPRPRLKFAILFFGPFLFPFLLSSYLLLLLSTPLASLLAPLPSPRTGAPLPPIWALRARIAAELAALKWIGRVGGVTDIVLRAAWAGAIGGGRVRKTLRYTASRIGTLHVYPPCSSPSKPPPAPVLVILHGIYYGPLRFRAWMVAPVAYRLSEKGYCAVVPEIETKGGLESAVRDMRAVLAWVGRNAASFGGDPEKIYVLGHGLGAHLPLLLTIQTTAVRSRALYPPGTPVPNGLAECRIYGSDIEIPPIEGLILLSPITDTQKHVERETALAPARSWLGPTLKTALFHSPAHLLFAARQVLDVSSLPRFLFIHGGEDEVVGKEQTEVMWELLVGAGAEGGRERMYRWMGHAEALTCLASEKGYYSESVMRDVLEFAPLE